uniref:ATP-dependent DNA helicase n=1 Tax=Strigamia maritima TaxID=126957 RepID=T1IVW9_STRMM
MIHRIEILPGANSALLLAPTGVAANNIGGATIHSALHVHTLSTIFTDLTGESLMQFQQSMQNIRYVIIDEMSMLGLNLLLKIDQRLRQAKPESADVQFDGLFVYLFGDFAQLPPVGDKPLYSTVYLNHHVQAKALYLSFKKAFILTSIMRQVGDDQIQFKHVLFHIANGCIDMDDYNLISTRFLENNYDLREIFNDSVHLMGKNVDIDEFNYRKLQDSNLPEKHNNATAASATQDEAQGLVSNLYLSVGTKVILRKNLWTDKGLCNGSIGIITDIIYKENSEVDSYYEAMPICILVEFEKYTGPTFIANSIPIVPLSDSKKNIACTRKQFSLAVAYAISIHRSQGVTLDKAVVNIGNSEFAVGLKYVAFSRFTYFNISRLIQINNKKAMVERCQEFINFEAMNRYLKRCELPIFMPQTCTLLFLFRTLW